MNLSFSLYVNYFFLTNHPPSFEGSDEALIARLHYIFFETKFVDNPSRPNEKRKDPNFIENLLKNEINDVFSWILEGSKNYWKEEHINLPATLETYKKEFVDSEDTLGDFLIEKTEQDRNSSILVSKLYECYKDWCFEGEREYYNVSIFSRNIAKKGIEKRRGKKGCKFLYIKIREDSK